MIVDRCGFMLGGSAAIVCPLTLRARSGGRPHRFGAVFISMYAFKEDVAAGGLAAFGVDVIDLFLRVVGYADKIFRGAGPGELPVKQPAKFQLIIKAARSLGITVAPLMLARADEVLE